MTCSSARWKLLRSGFSFSLNFFLFDRGMQSVWGGSQESNSRTLDCRDRRFEEGLWKGKTRSSLPSPTETEWNPRTLESNPRPGPTKTNKPDNRIPDQVKNLGIEFQNSRTNPRTQDHHATQPHHPRTNSAIKQTSIQRRENNFKIIIIIIKLTKNCTTQLKSHLFSFCPLLTYSTPHLNRSAAVLKQLIVKFV